MGLGDLGVEERHVLGLRARVLVVLKLEAEGGLPGLASGGARRPGRPRRHHHLRGRAGVKGGLEAVGRVAHARVLVHAAAVHGRPTQAGRRFLPPAAAAAAPS